MSKITNLIGTTWQLHLNNLYGITAGYGVFDIDGSWYFDVSGQIVLGPSDCVSLAIGYYSSGMVGLDGLDATADSIALGGIVSSNGNPQGVLYFSLPAEQDSVPYISLTITGGEDITNQLFIDFINTYGTLVSGGEEKPTAESVKAKLENLIAKANTATSKEDKTLTAAVNTLIEGYGQGECDGIHVIEVEELPEVGETGVVYKVPKKDLVGLVGKKDGEIQTDTTALLIWMFTGQFVDLYEYNKYPDIENFSKEAMHYVESDNSFYVFDKDTNEWQITPATAENGFMGTVTSLDEITNDGYYMMLRIDYEYYEYREKAFRLLLVDDQYNFAFLDSVFPVTTVPTRPDPADVVMLTDSISLPYYVEDEDALLMYNGTDWEIFAISGVTGGGEGAVVITDLADAMEPGSYLYSEGGYKRYHRPMDIVKMQEPGIYDVENAKIINIDCGCVSGAYELTNLDIGTYETISVNFRTVYNKQVINCIGIQAELDLTDPDGINYLLEDGTAINAYNGYEWENESLAFVDFGSTIQNVPYIFQKYIESCKQMADMFIEVDQLPEIAPTDRLYKCGDNYYQYYHRFEDILYGAGDTMLPPIALFEAFSEGALKFYKHTIPTRASDGIIESTQSEMHVYHIEDENDAFIYIQGEWLRFITAMELGDVPFGGVVDEAPKDIEELQYYIWYASGWYKYAQVSGSLEILENGEYDVTNIETVTANLPTKSIAGKYFFTNENTALIYDGEDFTESVTFSTWSGSYGSKTWNAVSLLVNEENGTQQLNYKFIEGTSENSSNPFWSDTSGATWWIDEHRYIDFGKVPQSVHEPFYNLIINNTIPVYDVVIDVAYEAEMNALLEVAEIGTVYRYIGPTTENYQNGALYVVQIPMVSFTIDGADHQGEEDMTWAEWCASEYNTIGCVNADAEELIYNSDNTKQLMLNDVAVYGKDVLAAGAAYVFITIPVEEPSTEEPNDYGTTVIVNQYGEEDNDYGTTVVIGEEDEVNLITFTLDGTEYQAEENMTWGQWVESEYNTGGYVASGDYINDRGGLTVVDPDNSFTSVKTSETIINGHVYGSEN